MSKLILKEINDLLTHQVISPETAQSIRDYYQQKETQGSNRLIVVFGILGSLLVSLGLILIIAHNWDSLPKSFKLVIALAPLLIGQIICAYLLLKKVESNVWREGVSIFLIFAVAMSISIVSQVYNISGNLGNFLTVWMILSIPVVYIMRSPMASLICWAGVAWLGFETNYFRFGFAAHQDLFFWPLLAALVPWYVHLMRKHPQSNYTYFHHWFVVFAVVTLLGTFEDHNGDLMMPAYMSLFGALVLIGQLPAFSKQKLITNAYLIGGSLGTIGLLLSLSFDWYWNDIFRNEDDSWFYSVEMIAFVVLFFSAFYLLIVHERSGNLRKLLSKSFAFLIFVALFFMGLQWPHISQALINVLILFLGVTTVLEGAQADRLWHMNYGLLILTGLITCRFFDTDLSFVVRGLLFIAVGVGFFGVNYWMVQKRKNEQRA